MVHSNELLYINHLSTDDRLLYRPLDYKRDTVVFNPFSTKEMKFYVQKIDCHKYHLSTKGILLYLTPYLQKECCCIDQEEWTVIKTTCLQKEDCYIGHLCVEGRSFNRPYIYCYIGHLSVEGRPLHNLVKQQCLTDLSI